MSRTVQKPQTAPVTTSVLAACCMLLFTIGGRGDTANESLLFIGQDPNPAKTGLVAYKVGKERLNALPDWGPDTSEAPPPLGVSAAVSTASKEIAVKFNYEAKRLQLNEVVLMKAPLADRNVWYYVVVHVVNTAKNPYHPHPNDYKEIRVVVLMDGGVVAPSDADLSQHIRF